MERYRLLIARRVMRAERSMNPAPPAQSRSCRRDRSPVNADLRSSDNERRGEEALILVSSAIVFEFEDASGAVVSSLFDSWKIHEAGRSVKIVLLNLLSSQRLRDCELGEMQLEG